MTDTQNTCCRCKAEGKVIPAAGGEPITIHWVCAGCGEHVCFNCTLTVPHSKPLRFYEDTLCSDACRVSMGIPEEDWPGSDGDLDGTGPQPGRPQ